MRGADRATGSLFSHVDLEERVPAGHPLRAIRRVVNDALASLDGEFAGLHAAHGRPSIPPERLIRASLLQILHSVRSERQPMEQMDYTLLFRRFVGLGVDDPVWVPTVFTKNRDRLLTTEMSRKVMAAILAHAEVAPLLSDEHVSVDGTLVKAFATGLEPVATPWLTLDEELPAASPGTRRRTATGVQADHRKMPPPPMPTKPLPRPRPTRCPRPPAPAATPRSTSGARGARTRRTRPRPTRTRGSVASRRARGRSCASRGMP
jgi:transposase